jgi:cytochrome bd ubiquinol oxidase subunit I
MRTKDAVSNHSVLALSSSLAIFVVMYLAVFGTGVSYMLKLVARGPQPVASLGDGQHERGQSLRPARPLSAAPDDIDPAPSSDGGGG